MITGTVSQGTNSDASAPPPAKRAKIDHSRIKPLPRSGGQIDGVRIGHVIRFKDSSVSGSEWRTNVDVELLYKGEVVARKTASDINSACLMVANLLHKPWKFDHSKIDLLESTKCCQTGCTADARVFYRVKTDKCHHCQHENTSYPMTSYDPQPRYDYRIFCDAHSFRGVDCGLDDGQHNYERVNEYGEVMENPPPPTQPDPAVVSVPAIAF